VDESFDNPRVPHKADEPAQEAGSSRASLPPPEEAIYFGDEVTATAMIDRLVHHAEIVSLKGDSYRLKDRNLARTPPAEN
jgi:hypothetical protein